MTAHIKGGNGAIHAVEEYWLNEEQSLATLTLLRTPEGKKARVIVIKTFAAVRRGDLQPRQPQMDMTVLATTVATAVATAGGWVKIAPGVTLSG